MKKYIAIFVIIFVCIAIVSGILLSVQCTWTFSLADYSEMMDKFPSDLELGAIDTSADALAAAEQVWTSIYGQSINNKIPYRVSFDEEEQVWLVRGSYFFVFPGGPHILIRQEDGRVLAVWHDKA